MLVKMKYLQARKVRQERDKEIEYAEIAKGIYERRRRVGKFEEVMHTTNR